MACSLAREYRGMSDFRHERSVIGSFVIALTSIVTLVACESGADWAQSRDAEILNTYIGATQQSAIAQWGQPSDVYHYGDGTKELTYIWTRNVGEDGERCEWTFIVDDEGQIVSWRRTYSRLGAGACEYADGLQQ